MKRIIELHETGGVPVSKAPRARNCDEVTDLVAKRVKDTSGIDWGELRIDGVTVHVFCAVLAWSRFRFVRFAADEKAATTLAMLAECFERQRELFGQ